MKRYYPYSGNGPMPRWLFWWRARARPVLIEWSTYNALKTIAAKRGQSIDELATRVLSQHVEYVWS